jgi:regulatory protein
MNEDIKEAWLIAIRLLSRREYSQHEITLKLRAKQCEQSVIAETLNTLIKQGYQSDSRFSEHFTRFRASKGYGPKRIRQELRDKGVAEDVIEVGIEAAEIDWNQRAADVHAKKFKGEPAESWEEQGKQTRFLDYRGFTREQIEQCVHQREE